MGLGDNPYVKSAQQQYQGKLQVMQNEEKNLQPVMTLEDPNAKETKAEDSNKQTVNIKIPFIPGANAGNWNSSNTTTRELPMFNGGTASEFLETMDEYDLAMALRGGTHAQKRNLFRQVLGPQSSKKFSAIEAKLVESNNALDAAERQTDEQLFKRALNKFAQSVFPNWKHAGRNQKRYMSQLVIQPGQSVQDFISQVEQMNDRLKYFPVPDAPEPVHIEPFSTAKLVEIIDLAKKPRWQSAMARQNKSYYDFETVDEIRSLFSSFQQADEIDGLKDEVEETNNKVSKAPRGKKRTRGNGGKENQGKNNPKTAKTGTKCKHCGKVGAHAEDACWELDKNKDKRPKGWKSVKGEPSALTPVDSLNSDYDVQGEITQDNKRLRIATTVSDILFSAEQQAKPKVAIKPSKKRSFTDMEDKNEDETLCPMVTMLSKENSNNKNSDDEFDGYPEYLNPFFNRDELTKKTKIGHYTAEIVIEIVDKNNKIVPIRGLLDTGTSSTILLRDFVKKGRANGYSGKTTEWKTLGGNFKTKKKALVCLLFGLQVS